MADHAARIHRRGRLTRAMVLSLFVAVGSYARAANLFVATTGDDVQPGTMSQPMATLARARDAARELRRTPGFSDSITIYLRKGVYRLEETFVLTSEDSGTANAPVVFRPWENEAVFVSGARVVNTLDPVIDPDILRRLPPVSRGHVFQSELTSQGVSDFGDAVALGRRLEVFVNHQPMTLARWPNDGFVRIVAVNGGRPITSHGLKGDEVGQFTYEGDRPTRWIDEREIWLHGYWFWDWSDAWQRVERIDAQMQTIRLTPPFHGYGYRAGQRYYAANLLCELDQPGEWYLDRDDGSLFLWPPEGSRDASVEVSLLDKLVSLKDAQWIGFEGIVFESTRGTAMTIAGGSDNHVAGCVVRNVGSWGIEIEGGRANGVVGCDILGTGEGGIRLSGGDRVTLRPAGHYATNNHIHHFGRLQRTYRPAVSISGVGQAVTHNLIHDGPHNAIQLSGNDHVIELNEIHHVCFETGDVGAFYTGRDWTARGTVIRHNYFHDLQGPGLHGAMAVYLDDAASGFTISGNLFVRAGRAAFIGGGRDNLIENNLFVDCEPSVHVDARGLGWMKDHVDAGGTLPNRLADVPYQQPPWSDRYPQLVNILEEDPGAPRGNVIRRNISVGGTWANIDNSIRDLVTLEDNLVDADPGVVDLEGGSYTLRDDVAVQSIGFQAIPFLQIGLEKDHWREALPK